MGIGKLAFLEFVAEAVDGSKGVAGRDRAIQGDYFVSRRLGLGFVKPSAWYFHAFEDFEPKLAGNIFVEGSVMDGADFSVYGSDLVVVVSKYPLGSETEVEKAAVGPSIAICSSSRDKEDAKDDLKTLVSQTIDLSREILRDFLILEPPRFQMISMCPAARFTSQFIMEHSRTMPTLVRVETLVIDQGACVYSINLTDLPAIGHTAAPEFDAFVGTLHFA